ncbi:MAG TPA: sigma-70 family RNA polymerase sigma factor [Bacteroidales bacterium]|nr:sigma-70 family RNA polymerase sigma factor [Bacteroidales bacterium]
MEINPNLTDKAIRDCKLVEQAIKNGDQRAYAELMNNYKDSLYYMLLKMTNDPDDADDLTIEAFGKAFKNLHQYTSEYAFSTWLFKIASNNCIDFLRKKKKGIISIDEVMFNDDNDMTLSDNLPSSILDPEEKFIKKQKINLIRDIVDKLKPRYKTLIELRYFKELSYEEIAANLNLPLGTVKAQLFRARDLLFNILKNSQESI